MPGNYAVGQTIKNYSIKIVATVYLLPIAKDSDRGAKMLQNLPF